LANGSPFTRIYDNEYYSSNQTFIYIGDVLIDEITSFSFNLIQPKTPVYGYASQLFDGCSAGHVLVQGNFTINFKESGYLWAVLRRWHNIDNEALGIRGVTRDPLKKNLSRALMRGKKSNGDDRPIIGSNGTKVMRGSIERVVQGNVSRGELYDFYNNLAGYATSSVNSPKDKAFEDIVEAFEDEIWKTNDNNELLQQLRRTDDNMFDGFDIYVVYGNYANPKANHTCKKIVGVRLISQGQQIQLDDSAIQEQYSFIARSIV